MINHAREGDPFAAAAARLERDAERGELLWTDPDGSQCWATRDEHGSMLTVTRPGEPDFVQRVGGIDYRGLR